jgi:hypothetical protein
MVDNLPILKPPEIKLARKTLHMCEIEMLGDNLF